MRNIYGISLYRPYRACYFSVAGLLSQGLTLRWYMSPFQGSISYYVFRCRALQKVLKGKISLLFRYKNFVKFPERES